MAEWFSPGARGRTAASAILSLHKNHYPFSCLASRWRTVLNVLQVPGKEFIHPLQCQWLRSGAPRVPPQGRVRALSRPHSLQGTSSSVSRSTCKITITTLPSAEFSHELMRLDRGGVRSLSARQTFFYYYYYFILFFSFSPSSSVMSHLFVKTQEKKKCFCWNITVSTSSSLVFWCIPSDRYLLLLHVCIY